MKECDCYHTEEEIIGWHTPVDPKTKMTSRCWGTRECEECSCGGDPTKCNFYPEVREKALKEREPKLGEWISIKDRLPEKAGQYWVVLNNDEVHVVFYSERTGFMADIDGVAMKRIETPIIYWMPYIVPSPPTEKEN